MVNPYTEVVMSLSKRVEDAFQTIHNAIVEAGDGSPKDTEIKNRLDDYLDAIREYIES